MAELRSRARTLRLVTAAVLLMLLALPTVAFAAAARPVAPAAGLEPAQTTPAVTWNGVDVASANSPSSALTISYNAAANVAFTWSSTYGPTANVATARLAMIYFGFALSTRDVPPVAGGLGPSESAVMNWTVGPIQYLVEGIYGVTASLIAQNGSTVWSENFYLKITAPGSILAAVPILVILIMVYELYNVARSGRYIRLSAKSPPKTGGSSSSTAEPPATEAPAAPGTEATPPAAESPPPGGRS